MRFEAILTQPVPNFKCCICLMENGHRAPLRMETADQTQHSNLQLEAKQAVSNAARLDTAILSSLRIDVPRRVGLARTNA